jgi:hypothetical protein
MALVLHDTWRSLHLPARWPRRHLPLEKVTSTTRYDYMEVDTEFARSSNITSDTREHCEYDLRIFPSK